ncbi:hypothetical protein D3C87_583750 [compost metagenome]
MCIRIVLTNTEGFPTREELSTRDRNVGEKYFEGIDMEWGGHIVIEDKFNLSAQWLAPIEAQEAVLSRIEHTELKGYEVNVFLVDDEELEELILV